MEFTIVNDLILFHFRGFLFRGEPLEIKRHERRLRGRLRGGFGRRLRGGDGFCRRLWCLAGRGLFHSCAFTGGRKDRERQKNSKKS